MDICLKSNAFYNKSGKLHKKSLNQWTDKKMINKQSVECKNILEERTPCFNKQNKLLKENWITHGTLAKISIQAISVA